MSSLFDSINTLQYLFELLIEANANASACPLALDRPPAEPTVPLRRAAAGQHDGGQRAPGARRRLRVRQHGGRQVPRGGEDGGAQRLLQSHCQGDVSVLKVWGSSCVQMSFFKKFCNRVDASIVDFFLQAIHFLFAYSHLHCWVLTKPKKSLVWAFCADRTSSEIAHLSVATDIVGNIVFVSIIKRES